MTPDFDALALATPYSRDEWRRAWELLGGADRPLGWQLVQELVGIGFAAPTDAAASLLRASAEWAGS